MVLPDLLASDRDWPQETRIIGVFPIMAILAELGIGAVLDWLSPWRKLKLAAVGMPCAAIGFTMQAQVAEFFGAGKNLGRMHWGGNTQVRRVDSGVVELCVKGGQSYMLLLPNYTGSVIKDLTCKRALEVRSAVAPRYFGVSAIATIPTYPAALLVHGADDVIVSSTSLLDLNCLGSLGASPSWPRADFAPTSRRRSRW